MQEELVSMHRDFEDQMEGHRIQVQLCVCERAAE